MIIILGYSVTLGLSEIIIFLIAAVLLGFSIHFYWAGRRSVPGLQKVFIDPNAISEDDEWRLQFYEQIEKHEQAQERLRKELHRMAEAEKILLKELEETREEAQRLEKLAEKTTVTEKGMARSNMSELVIAQQNLNESLLREMTERLEKTYEEFRFLQDRIEKLQSEVVDPQRKAFAQDELEQSYYRAAREYEDVKMKNLSLLEENQRLARALDDAEERFSETSFQKQQLSKKVQFLEELTTDLQLVSGHQKKLEGQLRRITEIESALARATGDKR